MMSEPPHCEAPDAPEAANDPRQYVLKHGDMFMVGDAIGNIDSPTEGLFYNDTRMLSHFKLSISGRPLSLLGAAVGQDNVTFQSNLTNKPLPPIGGTSTPEGIIHIERTRILWEARLYERIRTTNYGRQANHISLNLGFAADFHDMFEVRGIKRKARGTLLAPVISTHGVEFNYHGLDGIARASIISLSAAPSKMEAAGMTIEIALAPGGTIDLFLEVGIDQAPLPSEKRFTKAMARAQAQVKELRDRGVTIETSGRVFSEWLGKSRADIALLTTELDTGPYPYAGIPWFSTAFGRDAIITSLQMLWLDPSLARGVLRFLSANQATETSAFFDSAPGKIMHEMRKGEMVHLGELPFLRYYGGVDTTPLYVMLAGAYAERTGDLTTIETHWPNLLAAMDWIESASTKDGFLSYARGAETGLANQGWKDSADSVFDAAGDDVPGPISLCEVQGYVFAACEAMASLAERLGAAGGAEPWQVKAERIRLAVEAKFWLEDLGTYAEALDGTGQACAIRTSNAGHLLFCRLPAPGRAALVTRMLTGPRFNSGWGIRTLAEGESRYNPMSYHNGSSWPHDTGLCAAGMAHYGEREAVVRLLSNGFEAAVRYEMRLPELMCGFERREGEPPIGYPVACRPQAWASGSGFMMLQAVLGLTIDAWRGEIHVNRPSLPSGIDWLTLHDIAIGTRKIDLKFQRAGDRIAVYPLEAGSDPIPVLIYG